MIFLNFLSLFERGFAKRSHLKPPCMYVCIGGTEKKPLPAMISRIMFLCNDRIIKIAKGD